MTPDREASIIRAVLAGDDESYGLLVEKYQRPIFNMMVRATGSKEEAADLTQETFFKGYQKLGTFTNGASFFSWIYTIGLNQSRDFLRRRRRRLSVEAEQDPNIDSAGDPQAHEEFARSLDGLSLKKALNGLKIQYREAVMLRYREDRSMDEIAQILGLTVSGAKMRVHRGLEQLKAIMNGEGDGT
jgi:RNA polymerase sigma-70 factor, ECF subfamily